MYYDFSIKIPEEKGKIIIKKKGNATYVLYQYGSKYNSDKKYAVPQRTIIGKLDPENEGRMFPNEKCQEFFADLCVPDELPESYRSCCLKIGSYAVIQKILKEYDLPKLLKKWFPDDCGLLIDLMTYLIVEEENAGQYYPDFAYNHPLFSDEMKIFSDSKVCRFLKSVTPDQIIGFLKDWNKKRDHKQRIYVSYDSTNKNCQAGDIDLIEYGKAKEEKGLPIFNHAIANDNKNQVPLFYEIYPGSITDVSQFEFLVEKIRSYNYKNVGFILDRGYFSKDNIRYMEKNNYSFIIMVKGRKHLVSGIIDEHRNTFETDRSCRIRAYRVYGKTIKGRLYEDDTCDRYFHLYFNASRQFAEREQLEQMLDKQHLALEKSIGKEVDLSKNCYDYFELICDKKNCLVSFKEKTDVIQQQLQRCGYFCIVTSEEMTASQALNHYKGRDISEKLFRADKSFLGSKSMRVQTVESLSSKVFIEFVALIVRNRIYNLLKENTLKMESRPNYMTVPAAIRELEKIEMVKRNDGSYRLDHAISKRQKTILGSFGMDVTSIKEISNDISTILAKNQSLLASSNCTDEIDEEDDYDGTFEEYFYN